VPLILIVGLVLAFICIVVFVVLSLKTEDVVGQVQAVEWVRTIGIEALQPVPYSDWKDEIPNDVEMGSCREEYHHTQSEPTANSKEVCGTPYTVDTGSGAGEVVQDCEYEVYAEWCEYTVEEWRQVDAVEITGRDLHPVWPEVSLSAGEREGDRDQAFAVVFVADGDQYVYELSSETQFVDFEIGSEWVLEINSLGGLVSVTPAE
jgi:hypothetical protein